jgi:hypothetical protein
MSGEFPNTALANAATFFLLVATLPLKERGTGIGGNTLVGPADVIQECPVDAWRDSLVRFSVFSNEAETALLQGNCIGWLWDDTAFQERLVDPEWAAFEMPLETILTSPWGAAVRLEERDGPWGRFIAKTITDWHHSGKLIETEKKWGISPSAFLSERNYEVDRGVGDRPMAEPPLNSPGVVPLVGEGVPVGVAQHVRVCLELQAGASGSALDHAGEAGRRERRTALADEHEGRRRALAMERA